VVVRGRRANYDLPWEKTEESGLSARKKKKGAEREKGRKEKEMRGIDRRGYAVSARRERKAEGASGEGISMEIWILDSMDRKLEERRNMDVPSTEPSRRGGCTVESFFSGGLKTRDRLVRRG